MMLGVSGNTTTHPAAAKSPSLDGGAEVASKTHQESGGGCIMEFGGAVEGEQRSTGGANRWPRQETMALLKIRSEMDAAFRDSSLKGPLWEEVSRKMAELGYKRNAKKCREKFENVFKYHKRTKEGRSSKSEGKTYKFFDQLAALENIPITPPSQSSVQHLPSPPPPHPTAAQMQQQVVHADPISVLPPAPRSTASPNVAASQPPHHHQQNYANVSNSSSTSSDEDIERRQKRKRKKKDEEYIREVMKGVVEKQVELHKRFLETLENKERERMMREEAWRNQEMERIRRECDLLAQERSMAATRHAALVSFLEKMTHTQNPQNPSAEINEAPTPPPMAQPPQFALPQLALTLTPPPPRAATTATPAPPLPLPLPVVSPPPVMVPPPVAAAVMLAPQDHNGDESSMSTPTSSRWPKAEIEALIKIRSSLDNKYQENGPKGPLWEEVSSEMNNLGYKRSSKRCKEKWENINKYFKKVKDNNKKRSEASKTCPYFYQLHALYKEKAKGSTTNTSELNYSNYANALSQDNQMMQNMSQFDEDPEREDVEYEEAEGEGHQ